MDYHRSWFGREWEGQSVAYSHTWIDGSGISVRHRNFRKCLVEFVTLPPREKVWKDEPFCEEIKTNKWKCTVDRYKFTYDQRSHHMRHLRVRESDERFWKFDVRVRRKIENCLHLPASSHVIQHANKRQGTSLYIIERTWNKRSKCMERVFFLFCNSHRVISKNISPRTNFEIVKGDEIWFSDLLLDIYSHSCNFPAG